jgi:uncharacterized spore protein YtfJ
MEQVADVFGLVSSRLKSVADTKAVVGEPIELAGATIVPISRVSVGFGGGGGLGEGESQQPKGDAKPGKGKGSGAVTGGGGKIRPVAVAVFTEGGVEILPIADPKGKLDKLVDKIPEWIEQLRMRGES